MQTIQTATGATFLVPDDGNRYENRAQKALPVWSDENGGGLIRPDGTVVSTPDIGTGFQYQRIATPTGFAWTDYPFIIYRALDGTITTDFDITSNIPTVTVTYYVDPVSGLDANAGTTRGAPLLNLATALAKTDVDQIRIINLTSDFYARTTKTWNNVQPTRSLSVVVEGSYRYIQIGSTSSSAPTWSLNATYSNVYQATISSTNSQGVVDLKASNRTVPYYTTDDGEVVRLTNIPTDFAVATKVADLATVAITPGSWFNDGTVTYFQPLINRIMVGDGDVWCLNSSNIGRFPNLNSIVIYMDGLEFVGGRPFYALTGATVTATGGASGAAVITTASTANVTVGMVAQGTGVPTGSTVVSLVANTSITISANLTATASGTYNFSTPSSKLYHKRCSFQAASASNGLSIQGALTVVGYRSNASLNWDDGFNYHSFESNGTTQNTSPKFVEIECCGWKNGNTGSTATSDNATTSHDYVYGIRINCAFPNSSDRPVADVNFAQNWILGVVSGQATTTAAGKENFAVLNTAQTWLDSCTALAGGNARWLAADTAKLKHYNSGTVVNASTAEATGTISAYPA